MVYGCKVLNEFLIFFILISSKPSKYSDLYNLDGIAEIRELPVVGCEAFAEYVYSYVNQEVEQQTTGRVKLVSVECFEHGANSALFGNF